MKSRLIFALVGAVIFTVIWFQREARQAEGFGAELLKVSIERFSQIDGYRDNKEFVVGQGHRVNCTRIPPGDPGSWIDNKRCSYRFRIAGAAGKTKWYACRGYGEGIVVTCRRMKHAPPGHR